MQKRVSETILDIFSFHSYSMGSDPSAEISIRFAGKQPFVAGKQITGTVMFNNTSGKSLKFQRIYAKVFGEVIFMVSGRYGYTTCREPFFKQLINLEEKEVRKWL